MHFVLLRVTRRMWPELETMVPPDRRHGLADVPGVIFRLPCPSLCWGCLVARGHRDRPAAAHVVAPPRALSM